MEAFAVDADTEVHGGAAGVFPDNAMNVPQVVHGVPCAVELEDERADGGGG